MTDQEEKQTLSQENCCSLNEEQLQAISGSGWNPFTCCFKPSTTDAAVSKANKSIQAAQAAVDKANRHVKQALDRAKAELAAAEAKHTRATGLSNWTTQAARNAD